MAEKGPWGNKDVLRHDAQMATIKELRFQLRKALGESMHYEVIERSENIPEISFKELESGTWEKIVTETERLVEPAKKLLADREIGTLTTRRDNAERVISIIIRG